MKKKIILICILLYFSPPLFSQTDQLNHEKYWYYRYRFKHYFTSVGPELYQSLVSARRNTYQGSDIYYGDQTLDMG